MRRPFIEHLNPRTARVVALPKPTEVEQGQWYFQRYANNLPNPGEIRFFDRSWDEQEQRFNSRRFNPLKQWKISPVEEHAQERWDVYTKYKEEMFSRTHTSYSPWIIVKANNKKRARLESMRHVLNRLDYESKDQAGTSLHPDPDVVRRFHRSSTQID